MNTEFFTGKANNKATDWWSIVCSFVIETKVFRFNLCINSLFCYSCNLLYANVTVGD